MKRPAAAIAILVGILLCGVSTAYADKTTTTTADTVQRYDRGYGPPDCTFQGFGCTVIIVTTVETGSVITPSGGGLLLHVGSTDMYGEVARGGLPTYTPLASRAITFPPTTTVTIDDSPAYPFLNGRTINIGGISTDVNGGYTVSFIP